MKINTQLYNHQGVCVLLCYLLIFDLSIQRQRLPIRLIYSFIILLKHKVFSIFILLLQGMLKVTLKCVLSFKERQGTSCEGFVSKNNQSCSGSLSSLKKSTCTRCQALLYLTHISPSHISFSVHPFLPSACCLGFCSIRSLSSCKSLLEAS